MKTIIEMSLGALDVIMKVAVAVGGAYGGLMLLLLAGSAWTSENALLRELDRRFRDGGIPIGDGVLPWFALVWLSAAILGALCSLWLWRRILRAAFGLFGRRLIDE